MIDLEGDIDDFYVDVESGTTNKREQLRKIKQINHLFKQQMMNMSLNYKISHLFCLPK